MGGFPVNPESRLHQNSSVKQQAFDETLNPLDSPRREKIHSPYASIKGESAIDQSLDSRFAATMKQKNLGHKPNGILSPNNAGDFMRSPQLGQIAQRSSMRGP